MILSLLFMQLSQVTEGGVNAEWSKMLVCGTMMMLRTGLKDIELRLANSTMNDYTPIVRINLALSMTILKFLAPMIF